MKSIRLIWIAAALALLSGCAFGDAHLNVAYDNSKAIAGPLSAVSPQQVTVNTFADKTTEPGIIGYKRNGYGAHTADIKSEKPVGEIVQNALTSVFAKGGHAVGDNGDIEVTGDVTKFWFDVKTGFWTVQFMGNTAVHLVVKDRSDASVIYEHDYQGSYTEESMGGLDKTWEKVMNEALAKLCENISLDVDLATALKSHAAGQSEKHLAAAAE